MIANKFMSICKGATSWLSGGGGWYFWEINISVNMDLDKNILQHMPYTNS